MQFEIYFWLPIRVNVILIFIDGLHGSAGDKNYVLLGQFCQPLSKPSPNHE